MKCGRGEPGWPEVAAPPAERCGPGADWLASGVVRGAGYPVPKGAGWPGPELGGAGAATATWANC